MDPFSFSCQSLKKNSNRPSKDSVALAVCCREVSDSVVDLVGCIYKLYRKYNDQLQQQKIRIGIQIVGIHLHNIESAKQVLLKKIPGIADFWKK